MVQKHIRWNGKINQTVSYLITIIFGFIIMGCQKTPGNELSNNLPILITNPISSITSNSAICGGTITNDGGATVTAKGVTWSTMPSPTIALNTKTNEGSGIGVYKSSISGLKPNTKYYIRAYVTSLNNTSYGNEISFTTTGTDVYVLGWEEVSNTIGIAKNSVIKVWKNGNSTTISDPSNYASDIAFAVSGSDVYVLGIETNPAITTPNNYHYDMKLWKNGVVVSVIAKDYSGPQLGDIYVTDQNDIYIVYSKYNSVNKNYNIAIWKNGIESNLTNSSLYNTTATSIKVVGADIYVAGMEIQHKKNYDPSYPTIAKLWKNTVSTSLTSGKIGACVNLLFVSGSDVYVGGYEQPLSYINDVFIWKNGAKNPIPIMDLNAYGYRSMCVFDNDVYVCGISSSYFPTIWKNGQTTNLSTIKHASADAITVFASDVFVAGTIPLGADVYYQKAVIWKNGILSTLSSVRSGVTALIVK